MARAFRPAAPRDLRPGRLPSPTRRAFAPIRPTHTPTTGTTLPSFAAAAAGPGPGSLSWRHRLVYRHAEGLRGLRSRMGRA